VPGAAVHKHLKIERIFFSHVIQNMQLFICKKCCTAAIIWILKNTLEKHAKRNYTSKHAQTRIRTCSFAAL
jgi:hypothetical protein